MVEQQAFQFPVAARQEVPDQMIFACKDQLGAVRLMLDTSGYERKQVAMQLSISEAHLSEILSGKKNFPLGVLEELMDFCKSDIPLRWLANKRGFGLHRLKSALEMENENLKRQLDAITVFTKQLIAKEG